MKRIFYIFLLLLVAIPAWPETAGGEPESSHLCIGTGYGICYGGIGINFEFNPRLPASVSAKIQDYYGLSVGIGYTPGGVTYLFNLRIYPLGRKFFFQPRISVGYGVVGLIKKDPWWSPGDERRSEGFALGGGLALRLTSFLSFDGEATLIFPTDVEMEDLESGRLQISGGIRFHL
jgi:hypothetical protein